MVAGGDAAFVSNEAVERVLNLEVLELVIFCWNRRANCDFKCGLSYPKVNLQIPTAGKLTVADLEGDGHLVVSVQGLVEALAGMCFHLNIMSADKEREEP